MKSSKSIATGNPPDIAEVMHDLESEAWNVVLKVDGKFVTFAALNKTHADVLAKHINDCAWVSL